MYPSGTSGKADRRNSELEFETEIRHSTFVIRHSRCLPRKEVIHPQLPLRMPCYDFTLITSPTFVRARRGLRVLPALLV